MYALSNLCLLLVILLNFFTLGSARLVACIHAVALQGAALALLPITLHGFTGQALLLATVALLLKEHGCDVIDVSAGQTTREAKPIYGRMFQVPFSDQIRHEAGIPTMTVGNIQDADQVNTILAAGRADLCVLARPHLKDPYLTLHAAEAYGFFDAHWPPQYDTVRPRPRRE